MHHFINFLQMHLSMKTSESLNKNFLIVTSQHLLKLYDCDTRYDRHISSGFFFISLFLTFQIKTSDFFKQNRVAWIYLKSLCAFCSSAHTQAGNSCENITNKQEKETNEPRRNQKILSKTDDDMNVETVTDMHVWHEPVANLETVWASVDWFYSVKDPSTFNNQTLKK